MTEITHNFDEEEISKLSVGEKIQKGYYEVINEEEWQKDMRAKYGNMSEKCERLQKQLEIAISYLDVIYGLRGGGCFNCVEFARRARNKIKELDK